MADPAPADAAATADTGTPSPDASNGAELTPEQSAAVKAAENPDQVRAILSEASRRARQAEADAKAARQELQGLQDAGKSELEKATTRAERAEARAAELERSLLTASVASRHGIPADQAHRLIGATEDELEADAKALAKLLRPAEEPPPPDLGAGVRDTTGGTGSKAFSDRIRRQAQSRR